MDPTPPIHRSDPVPLDLDPASRRALEMDLVLEAVARHAVTAGGASRLRGLVPLADAAAIAAEQAVVAEAGRHHGAQGRLLPGALPDPHPALRALGLEGLAVEAAALRDLASIVTTAADLGKALAGLDPEGFPRLRAEAQTLPDLRAEAAEVLRHVGPDGRIADEASPELRRLRIAVVRVGERLRRMLESVVREPGAQTGIQDAFVTQRNGRFVVPVRADAARPVRGIVHAASSSGATLFVEPLESVELNNELVRLAEAEVEEQERILRGWTDRFRRRRPEVEAAVEGVVRVDTLQARALFAVELEAVTPDLDPTGGFRLVAVRHPLLDRRLREAGGRSVPLTVEIFPHQHVLVLSGPNAGGKTVALKALGLAVVMAQSGLPVTAAQASLPVFRQVRADIGDHQSIDADLSTFSAHMQAVARYLREADPPSLFLFDEIGTGTEPGEGAALARAVLERLARPGSTTVATTHLGALKTWALASPGVASAAMEFDTERLRPTYRVLLGVAGVSAGLDIAGRMGIEGAILSRAREHLGPAAERSEAYLDRLRALTAEAEARRNAAAELEAALMEERRRLASRAEADARLRQAEAEEALEQALREFREQGRRELEAIEDKKQRARIERDHAKAEIRLRAQASRRLAGSSPAPAPPRPFAVEPGAAVRVRSLDRDGTVVEVRADRVVVRLGTTTFTVPRADLGPPGPAPAAAPEARAAGTVRRLLERRGRGTGADADDDFEGSPPVELLLLGRTVDDALEAVDKFLDSSALAGHGEVRIVHGHGTGRLRSAVRRFLADHPHVAARRPGQPHEGGDGATVVTLR
jgi:DNA mismatch repair protein MutS2